MGIEQITPIAADPYLLLVGILLPENAFEPSSATWRVSGLWYVLPIISLESPNTNSAMCTVADRWGRSRSATLCGLLQVPMMEWSRSGTRGRANASEPL